MSDPYDDVPDVIVSRRVLESWAFVSLPGIASELEAALRLLSSALEEKDKEIERLTRERDAESARVDIVIAEFDAPWPHSHTVGEVVSRSLTWQIHECRRGVEDARASAEARAESAEAALTALQQERDELFATAKAAIMDEPQPNGEYVHALHCNASRQQPVGNDMCSCPLGRRIKKQSAHLERLTEALRTIANYEPCWRGECHNPDMSEIAKAALAARGADPTP